MDPRPVRQQAQWRQLPDADTGFFPALADAGLLQALALLQMSARGHVPAVHETRVRAAQQQHPPVTFDQHVHHDGKTIPL